MEDIINAASLIHKDAGEVIKQGHCLETPLQGRHDAIDEGDCCL